MAEQRMDGQQRVVIERVSPEIDCGMFGIKRVVGETVLVEADVFVYFDNDAKVRAPVDAQGLIARVEKLRKQATGNDQFSGKNRYQGDEKK